MKAAQGAGTKERDPSAPINGSSSPVLSPIPPAPLVEPAKRRRPIGFLAAAVVLAIAGGLGAVWAVNQSGERSEVVGVARQVDWGEVITAQDLAVVEVIPDVNLRPVPWADRSSLIGKRASTTLVPGSLVTDESVTSDRGRRRGPSSRRRHREAGTSADAALEPPGPGSSRHLSTYRGGPGQSACWWLRVRFCRRRLRIVRDLEPWMSLWRRRTPMRWRWPPRRGGSPSCWSPGADGMLIATVSAKGAPGVSVASLAWTLAWPRPVLLAECEPRGSDFQVGYAHDRAGAGRDLLAVHMNSKRGAAMDTAVREQVLQLDIEKSKWLLLGIPEPQQAAAIDWARLARTLSNLNGVDVIADCGAASSVSAPRQVWAAADLVVLLLRSTAASVRAAQLAIPRLRTDLNELGMGADRLAAVVIGPRSSLLPR